MQCKERYYSDVKRDISKYKSYVYHVTLGLHGKVLVVAGI